MVLIDGKEYSFADPSKYLVDEWDRKWRLSQVYSAISGVSQQMLMLEQDVKNNKLTPDNYKKLMDIKKEQLEQMRDAYLGTIEINGKTYSKEEMANAERISLSLVSPKMTSIELMELPNNTYTDVQQALSNFLRREDPLDCSFSDIISILEESKKTEISVIDVIKLLRDAEKGILVKKN